MINSRRESNPLLRYRRFTQKATTDLLGCNHLCIRPKRIFNAEPAESTETSLLCVHCGLCVKKNSGDKVRREIRPAEILERARFELAIPFKVVTMYSHQHSP